MPPGRETGALAPRDGIGRGIRGVSVVLGSEQDIAGTA